jgi:hypothetical protein
MKHAWPSRPCSHEMKHSETFRETFSESTSRETSTRQWLRSMQRFATFYELYVACNTAPCPHPCPKCPKMSRFSLFFGTFARYVLCKYGMLIHLCRIRPPQEWGILGHCGTFRGTNGADMGHARSRSALPAFSRSGLRNPPAATRCTKRTICTMHDDSRLRARFRAAARREMHDLHDRTTPPIRHRPFGKLRAGRPALLPTHDLHDTRCAFSHARNSKICPRTNTNCHE